MEQSCTTHHIEPLDNVVLDGIPSSEVAWQLTNTRRQIPLRYEGIATLDP